MARNRMIKPEFWSSQKIAELSLAARLTFIGMWNFADDYGVLLRSAKRISGEIFPFDDISEKKIENIFTELIKKNLISEIFYNEKSFFFINGWEEHQKFSNRSKRFWIPLIDLQRLTGKSNIVPISNECLENVSKEKEKEKVKEKVKEEEEDEKKSESASTKNISPMKNEKPNVNIQNLEQHLHSCWGREGKVGYAILTNFIALANKHGPEKLFLAIEEAGNYNKKSFKYVEAIMLNNGKHKGNGNGNHTAKPVGTYNSRLAYKFDESKLAERAKELEALLDKSGGN